MNQFANDVKYIEKVQKVYGELNGELHLVELVRSGTSNLGLSLAGNRDITTMSVFVVGIEPYGLAGFDGRIHIGDELLEVNGLVLYGRSHLNASAIIKGISAPKLKILLLRNNESSQQMAVEPLKRFAPFCIDSSLTLIPKIPKTPSPMTSFNGRILFEDTSSDQYLETTFFECDGSFETDGACNSFVDGEPSRKQQNEQTEKALLRKSLEVDDLDYNSDISVTNISRKEFPSRSHESSKENHTEIASPETSSEICQTNTAACGIVEETPIVDPLICAIISGKPTVISLQKGKQGLGIQIIGGSDTFLKSLFIFEIYKDGAAAKDGRLRVGDQILEANGENLTSSTYVQALHVLRQLTSTLRMVVLREETVLKEETLYDNLSVELIKKPGKGLGLSIISKREDLGVVISDIVKGGAADIDGQLMVGDHIITVNGEDIHEATQEYAAKLLKTLSGKVCLSVNRLKVGSRPPTLHNNTYVNMCFERGLRKSESHAPVIVDGKSSGKHLAKRKVLRYHTVTCLNSPED